ncbi:hypothetical protein [Cytobacillus solani]|uniref:Uncharacterized protein n=1 Tax=Cytobacillus solani TaxID=1637975 RepID=A0A0Q3VIF5_9BACI|nr:hypothetical protein [Cytobacillus solani]KQL20490.1 hypothetical protein AN957_19140 [Cytobacillus solani]
MSGKASLKDRVAWVFDGLIKDGVWFADEMKQELLDVINRYEEQEKKIEELSRLGLQTAISSLKSREGHLESLNEQKELVVLLMKAKEEIERLKKI